jgi:hypothetical protein
VAAWAHPILEEHVSTELPYLYAWGQSIKIRRITHQAFGASLNARP